MMFNKRYFTGAITSLVWAIAIFPAASPRASAADCSGSDCLVILDIRHGTRCGNRASVEVDIRNDSDQFLRGYVVFTLPTGRKQYSPTGLMRPGETSKGSQYVCVGTGEVGKVANTGSSPTYPPQN